MKVVFWVFCACNTYGLSLGSKIYGTFVFQHYHSDWAVIEGRTEGEICHEKNNLLPFINKEEWIKTKWNPNACFSPSWANVAMIMLKIDLYCIPCLENVFKITLTHWILKSKEQIKTFYEENEALWG